MKKIIILLLLTIISCKNNNTKSNVPTEKNETENILIELPELENWKEMYSNKFVKKRFDEFTNDNTEIIGVYLSNEISEQIDSFENAEFDDYAMFFKIKTEQNRIIKNSDLEKIFYNQIDNSDIKGLDIEDVINKAHSDTTLIIPEKTYVLFGFQTHENVYSAIKLIKPFKDDHDYILIYIYNLMNIKNHLIHGSYYLNFNGGESLDEVSKNNEIIISEFIERNKK